jgi:hypothetical protein
VQSEILEHFGLVWVGIVRNSYRERLLSSRRTAYLPDDDADMMLVLMYLLHSWHVGKVPRELSFKQLIAMARLCEKYDMNVQVSPFVRRWLLPHQEKLFVPGREEWLFVALQFGLERHYVALANYLMLSCRTDGERNLIAPGRHERLEGLVPDGALGRFLHPWCLVRGCCGVVDLLTAGHSGNPTKTRPGALGLPHGCIHAYRQPREWEYLSSHAAGFAGRGCRGAAGGRARDVHALQPRRADPVPEDPRLLAAHHANQHHHRDSQRGRPAPHYTAHMNLWMGSKAG